MFIQVDIEEARERLEELFEAAITGDEVVIAVAGVPYATIVPIDQPG